jgi:hypothetical protein
MKTILAAAVLAVTVPALTAPAFAQSDYRWNGDRDSDWDPYHHYNRGDYPPRDMTADERVYRGSDGRYYCKRSDGTTGLVAGAIGGGVLGAVLGGGTLGTLLGAGGGALLGKHLDERHDDAQNRANGYRCQ